jgi:hypothetical protein
MKNGFSFTIFRDLKETLSSRPEEWFQRIISEKKDKIKKQLNKEDETLCSVLSNRHLDMLEDSDIAENIFIYMAEELANTGLCMEIDHKVSEDEIMAIMRERSKDV